MSHVNRGELQKGLGLNNCIMIGYLIKKETVYCTRTFLFFSRITFYLTLAGCKLLVSDLLKKERNIELPKYNNQQAN